MPNIFEYQRIFHLYDNSTLQMSLAFQTTTQDETDDKDFLPLLCADITEDLPTLAKILYIMRMYVVFWDSLLSKLYFLSIFLGNITGKIHPSILF